MPFPFNSTDLALGYWVYPLLALTVMVEGPLATLMAAIVAATGYLNPSGVFVFAVLGNTLGDTGWYLLGYLSTLQTIGKYLHWVGLRPEHIAQLEADIQRNARRLLFVAKLSLGLVIPTLIATGLARVPWRRWSATLLLAECIWTGSLVIAGYLFGTYLQQLESGLRLFALGGSLLMIIGLGFYFARRQRDLSQSRQQVHPTQN